MTDDQRRAREWVRMMDEQIRNRTPAERDRLMQQHIAEGQTMEQRARSWRMLMDSYIERKRMQQHGHSQ